MRKSKNESLLGRSFKEAERGPPLRPAAEGEEEGGARRRSKRFDGNDMTAFLCSSAFRVRHLDPGPAQFSFLSRIIGMGEQGREDWVVETLHDMQSCLP